MKFSREAIPGQGAHHIERAFSITIIITVIKLD